MGQFQLLLAVRLLVSQLENLILQRLKLIIYNLRLLVCQQLDFGLLLLHLLPELGFRRLYFPHFHLFSGQFVASELYLGALVLQLPLEQLGGLACVRLDAEKLALVLRLHLLQLSHQRLVLLVV